MKTLFINLIAWLRRERAWKQYRQSQAFISAINEINNDIKEINENVKHRKLFRENNAR